MMYQSSMYWSPAKFCDHWPLGANIISKIQLKMVPELANRCRIGNELPIRNSFICQNQIWPDILQYQAEQACQHWWPLTSRWRFNWQKFILQLNFWLKGLEIILRYYWTNFSAWSICNIDLYCNLWYPATMLDLIKNPEKAIEVTFFVQSP